MPDEMRLLLAQRPDLKRWFSPNGSYRVPRVKVRSQKESSRILHNLVDSASFDLAASTDGFETISQSRDIEETLASRGQIIQGGMLHTQRRLGPDKGGSDSRVLHDAIKTSVQQIRAMRQEMHQTGHSVALIEKDEHDTARTIDEFKKKTQDMDTSSWQVQTLVETKKECKFRLDLFNRLVSERKRKELMVIKMEKDAEEHLSKAHIMSNTVGGPLHNLERCVSDSKKTLERKKMEGEEVGRYGRVLDHMQKRTLIAIRNAPVRINYLTASTKAYEDEIHQARRMLDASIHQDDAERREREDLLEHAKELESVQKKKIFEMENIAEKERERMKQGKKKEKERLTFARELVTMSAEERKQKMNEMIAGDKMSLEQKRKHVMLLQEENIDLILAFDRIEQTANNSNVDFLVTKFLSRENELERLRKERETKSNKLKQKQEQAQLLYREIDAAKLEWETLTSTGMKSAKTRAKLEKLETILKPLTRKNLILQSELENRMNQLRSLVATCLKIADVCSSGRDGGKEKENGGEKVELKVEKEDHEMMGVVVEDGVEEEVVGGTSSGQGRKGIREGKKKKKKEEKEMEEARRREKEYQLQQQVSARRKRKAKKKTYTGKVWPPNKMNDTIASMYEKKARADAIDDKKGNKRDTMSEFAKDYFRQQYGTTIAIVKLREFKGSLEIHLKRELQEEKKNESKKDDKKDGNKKDGNKKDDKKDGKTTTKGSKKNFLTRRMRWFYIFSGWSHEEEDDPNCRTPYRPEAIDAWLQVLCEILPMDSIEERMDDNPCLVSVEKVCRALGTDGEGLFSSNWRTTNTFKTLLSNLRKDDFNISPKKRRSGSSGNGSGNGSGSGNSNSSTSTSSGTIDATMDVDEVAQLVMTEWYAWKIPLVVRVPEPVVEMEVVVVETNAVDERSWMMKMSIDEITSKKHLSSAIASVGSLMSELRVDQRDTLQGAALYQVLEAAEAAEAAEEPPSERKYSGASYLPEEEEEEEERGRSSSLSIGDEGVVGLMKDRVVKMIEEKNIDDKDEERDEERDEENRDEESLVLEQGIQTMSEELEEMEKKTRSTPDRPKSRTELKSISKDVRNGKIRHVAKSDRKASIRSSALKESARKQRKADRGGGRRGGGSGGRGGSGSGGDGGQNGKRSGLLESDSRVISNGGTRRRGSLMERLSHQRTMSQHHALKEIVMDLSKAHANAAKNRKFGENKLKNTSVLGKIGLTIPKAPTTPRESRRNKSSKRGGSRSGVTPRTKFMKETQLKTAYG